GALLAAIPMLAIVTVPLIALASASSPSDIAAGARHPLFVPALWLSARTTVASLAVIVAAGTPLAWWLARASGRGTRSVELLVDLPVVIPPAVMGIALLQTFGPQGLLGPAMGSLGINLPFTTTAVVAAQVVVSAPFYIQGAAAAFRRVDGDLLIVARTLGQSPAGAFFRIAVPLALPGMVAGAALSWARALGEFGATLFFAGNFPGSTQTMPLAIYTALESDTRVAVALALVLAAASVLLLIPLRTLPSLLSRRVDRPSRSPHARSPAK
ncbi:MAG: molybdate ABC transporter permease subunit, partial [Gemmatimonadetes bacterium]|nr:molybdate ABC transporter permease subunit [Gemmatimonadota bacterium]MYI46518.1 molybdate ABC transporter permease subunit [Gemmatimonadota bacterium]